MAKAPVIKTELPWEDRWTVPTQEILLKVYKEQPLKVSKQLMAGVEGFENISKRLLHQGVSWRWSWIYEFTGGSKPTPLVYLVPNPEGMIVIVPITDAILESLPFRRLNRYIRESIKTASTKQSVDLHWVEFTPTASSEVEHIMDLIKRKHKFLTAESGS